VDPAFLLAYFEPTGAPAPFGAVTPGSQVYLVNLFKRPAQPVPGQAAWFPTRGIPPL